jgi:hypothetical protein
MSSNNYTARRRLGWIYKQKVNGQLVSTQQNAATATGLNGGSGLNNPNWRDQIKNHIDAGQTYGAVYYSFKGSRGLVTKNYHVKVFPPPELDFEETVEGFLGSLSGFGSPNPVPPSLLNGALGDFSRKAAQRISPFSGGVFLGELREAIHMIRHPAQTLFDSVKSYIYGAKKHRRRVGLKTWKKIGSELWLEAVFGWRPLISDVKSGAEALSRTVNGFRPNEHVVSAPSEVEVMIQPPTLVNVSVNNTSWYFTQGITEKASVVVEGAIRVAPSGSLNGAMETFGIGWDQVLPTAWELLPFSFVTDYFSNVGDVISSASIVSSRVVYISATTKNYRKIICDGFTGIQGNQDQARIRMSAGQFQASYRTFARTPLASPVPALQFECPGIGSMKWLNLGALAVALRD